MSNNGNHFFQQSLADYHFLPINSKELLSELHDFCDYAVDTIGYYCDLHPSRPEAEQMIGQDLQKYISENLETKKAFEFFINKCNNCSAEYFQCNIKFTMDKILKTVWGMGLDSMTCADM